MQPLSPAQRLRLVRKAFEARSYTELSAHRLCHELPQAGTPRAHQASRELDFPITIVSALGKGPGLVQRC